MVDAVAVATPDYAQFVGRLGEVWEKIADFQTRLAVRCKRQDRPHQRVLQDIPAGHHGAEAFGQRLSCVFHQVRFRIEQIDMAGAAMEKNPNDSFRERCKVWFSGCERICGRPTGGFVGPNGSQRLGYQQRGQRESADAAASTQQEIATGVNREIRRDNARIIRFE